MMNESMDLARGYIASGEFNGNRIPQHIQNQIVKSYCDANSLKFVYLVQNTGLTGALIANYGQHSGRALNT